LKSWRRVLAQVEGKSPGGEASAPVATLTTDNVPITAAGSNALSRSPWVIRSVRGSGLTRTDISANADVKATYYATGQVYTGDSGAGLGQNFGRGSIHTHERPAGGSRFRP
jgi:hypothetical protein